MTVTEDEAKTKWCPFARTPGYVTTTLCVGNRSTDGRPLKTTNCIGSSCMAWRWGYSLWNLEAKRWWQSGDPTNNAVEHRVTDRGRCGLAGD